MTISRRSPGPQTTPGADIERRGNPQHAPRLCYETGQREPRTGLDVIVRHPTWGSLVTVDVEGDIDPRSWVSAVRMYAMQVSLAYLNVTQALLGPSTEYVPSAPLPTPANSVFPDLPPPQKHRSRSVGCQDEPTQHSPAKFYHVFLDLRAFVASPCAQAKPPSSFSHSIKSKASVRNRGVLRSAQPQWCAGA